HRAHHRTTAGSDPAGRTDRLAGSGRYPADRGTGVRAQARFHDRDRHAQHAAGGTGERHDVLLLHGCNGRNGTDAADLHGPEAGADGSLHYGTLRMTIMTTTPQGQGAAAKTDQPLFRTTLTPRASRGEPRPRAAAAIEAKNFRFGYSAAK